MTAYKEIYNLRNDSASIRRVQDASLNNNSSSGLKIENNLLFATNDWFDAVESGIIASGKIEGIISNVFESGHNDYPQFEIDTDGVKSSWTREGSDMEYIIGRSIELTFALQKYKRPIAILGATAMCVLTIRVSKD